MSRILEIMDLCSQGSTHASFVISSEAMPLPLVNITVADGIVRSESNNCCMIREGVLVSSSDSSVTARVIRAFTIKILPTNDGYIATSSLSDIYEIEVTRGKAVRSYLGSLLDEIIWLQENKESLSKLLLRELERIESYLRIV